MKGEWDRVFDVSDLTSAKLIDRLNDFASGYAKVLAECVLTNVRDVEREAIRWAQGQ